MQSTPGSLLSRVLAPITKVRPDEAVTALLLTLNVFLLLAAYYLVKPVREGLILSLASGAEYKAYLSGAIAIVLLFAVPAYAWLVDRLPRRTLLVAVTLSFAAELVLFWLVSPPWDPAAKQPVSSPYLGPIFYVWVGIFNMMVVAQFWSFANDLYSEDQGKRLFPLIAIGMAIGATLGSKIAAQLIPIVGQFQMLLSAAVVLAACAGLFFWIDRREAGRRDSIAPKPKAVLEDRSGAYRLVFRNRYLTLLAAFALVFSSVNTNGEYILGKLVSASADQAIAAGQIAPAEKGNFIGAAYGDFFFYVNLLTFLLQTFVVSRLARWLGLGTAFLVMPVLAFGNAALISIVPLLAVVRIGKIAENATDYSLNNTLRQMLWLVTTREMKYKAKQAVDTFFVRMGDVTSALLVAVGVGVWGWAVQRFALANAALALIWIVLAVLIGRENKRLAVESK